jgi:regulator of replication initiation timing
VHQVNATLVNMQVLTLLHPLHMFCAVQGFIRVNQQLQSEVEQLQCQVGQMYQEMGQMEQQMGKIQLVADYFQQENERLQQEVQQLTAHLQQQQVAGGRGRGKGQSLFDMLQQHKAQSGEVMRLNKELQKHAFTDQALRVLADCRIDSSSIHNTPVAILCQAAAIPNMKLSKLRSLQKSLLLTTHPDKQGDAVMHQLLEDVMARWMAEPEFDV